VSAATNLLFMIKGLRRTVEQILQTTFPPLYLRQRICTIRRRRAGFRNQPITIRSLRRPELVTIFGVGGRKDTLIMPDHMHLFVRAEIPLTLAKLGDGLKGEQSSSRRAPKVRGQHVWQARIFRSSVLRRRDLQQRRNGNTCARTLFVLTGLRADEWPYQGEFCVLSIGHNSFCGRTARLYTGLVTRNRCNPVRGGFTLTMSYQAPYQEKLSSCA